MFVCLFYGDGRLAYKSCWQQEEAWLQSVVLWSLYWLALKEWLASFYTDVLIKWWFHMLVANIRSKLQKTYRRVIMFMLPWMFTSSGLFFYFAGNMETAACCDYKWWNWWEWTKNSKVGGHKTKTISWKMPKNSAALRGTGGLQD